MSEAALAPLSRQLGLPSHLRAADATLAGEPRMQAELFEAYVAALEREHGYAAMYSWLHRLYAPVVHFAVADSQPAPSYAAATAAASAVSAGLAELDAYGKRTGQKIKVTRAYRRSGPRGCRRREQRLLVS